MPNIILSQEGFCTTWVVLVCFSPSQAGGRQAQRNLPEAVRNLRQATETARRYFSEVRARLQLSDS